MQVAALDAVFSKVQAASLYHGAPAQTAKLVQEVE